MPNDQLLGGNAVFLAIALFIILCVFLGVRIVPQSEKHVVERFGRLRSVLGPGINFVVPFLDRVRHKVSILERQLPTASQDAITADNVMVKVETSVFYRIIEPEKTVYRIRDVDGAIATTVAGIVRSEIGKLELDQVQSNRAQLIERVREKVKAMVDDWGVEVTRAEILDVALDEATRNAMLQQLNAERARRAQDRRRSDQLLVKRGGGQELACAKEGVHRPLAIGGDEDEDAAGGGFTITRRGVEIDPGGAHVVAEHLAELIVGDLADEGALQAQCGEARQRVGRRSARKLTRGRHGFVKLVGPRLVDQGHAAAVQLQLVDQLFRAGGDHVDHGIADGDHVITRGGVGGHRGFLGLACVAFAPPSPLLPTGQAICVRRSILALTSPRGHTIAAACQPSPPRL